MTGSSPISTSATRTWGRGLAGAALPPRGPSGTAAERLPPQPNGGSCVLVVVNESRSECDDATQTRSHTGRTHSVAQDQETKARTLVSKSVSQRVSESQHAAAIRPPLVS